MKVYLIGSLRNPQVPILAQMLRQQFEEHEFFDSWYAAGPEADDKWRDYEKAKGMTAISALDGHAAGHVFYFDKEHLDESDMVVLVSPAGKSGHLELGYAIGKGKPAIYYMADTPDRWDVMLKFCTAVVDNFDDLVHAITCAIVDEL